MEVSSIFRRIALIRSKIDSAYDDIGLLIQEIHDTELGTLLNETNRLLSIAQKSMKDFDRSVGQKFGQDQNV
jgi:hypothetical protein